MKWSTIKEAFHRRVSPAKGFRGKARPRRGKALKRAINRSSLYRAAKPTPNQGNPKPAVAGFLSMRSAEAFMDSRGGIHKPQPVRKQPPAIRAAARQVISLKALEEKLQKTRALTTLTEKVDEIFSGWKVTYEWSGNIHRLDATQSEPHTLADHILNKIREKTDSGEKLPGQLVDAFAPLLASIDSARRVIFLIQVAKYLDFYKKEGQSPEDHVEFQRTIQEIVFKASSGLAQDNLFQLAQHLIGVIQKKLFYREPHIALLGRLIGLISDSKNKIHCLEALLPEIWENLRSSSRQAIGAAANKAIGDLLPNLSDEEALAVALHYVGQVNIPIEFHLRSDEDKATMVGEDDAPVSMAKAIPLFFSEHIFKFGVGGKYQLKPWHREIIRLLAIKIMQYETYAKAADKTDKRFHPFLGGYFVLTRNIFPVLNLDQQMEVLKVVLSLGNPASMESGVRDIFQHGLTPSQVKAGAELLYEQTDFLIYEKLTRFAEMPRTDFKSAYPQIARLGEFPWPTQ